MPGRPRPIHRQGHRACQSACGHTQRGAGDDVAGKVHASQHATGPQGRRGNQQPHRHGRAGRKPAGGNGERREPMTARERSALPLPRNERIQRAALVGPRCVGTAAVPADQQKSHAGHRRQRYCAQRRPQRHPPQQHPVGTVERQGQPVVDAAQQTRPARAALDSARPAVVAGGVGPRPLVGQPHEAPLPFLAISSEPIIPDHSKKGLPEGRPPRKSRRGALSCAGDVQSPPHLRRPRLRPCQSRPGSGPAGHRRSGEACAPEPCRRRPWARYRRE